MSFHAENRIHHSSSYSSMSQPSRPVSASSGSLETASPHTGSFQYGPGAGPGSSASTPFGYQQNTAPMMPMRRSGSFHGAPAVPSAGAYPSAAAIISSNNTNNTALSHGAGSSYTAYYGSSVGLSQSVASSPATTAPPAFGSYPSQPQRVPSQLLSAHPTQSGGTMQLHQLQPPPPPQQQQQQHTESLNRVKVVVRIRPPIAEDLAADVYGSFDNCTRALADNRTVVLTRVMYDDREFRFDTILPHDGQQKDMYDVVAKDIVDDVLKGYNGTVLAYGQTGTGKTWTIFGPNAHWEAGAGFGDILLSPSVENASPMFAGTSSWVLDPRSGVVPRAVAQIFDHIERNSATTEFRVTVSFLQIYMENIMDLLDATKRNLSIREDPKLGIFVDGLTQVAVRSPADMLDVIREGARNRAITATNMNKVSSRSHVILVLTVEQRSYASQTTTATASAASQGQSQQSQQQHHDSRVKRGVLTIVDLAGSERVAKSLSEGQRLEEAKKINKSLSALGNCVAALTEPNGSHVPFRDSKLTRLLTDSLGGNSKTCLCANVGPAAVNYDETYSTLLFATRCMAVRNHAVINEVVDFRSLTGTLQRQLSLMENEKAKMAARTVDLEREVSSLREEIHELRIALTRRHKTTAAGGAALYSEEEEDADYGSYRGESDDPAGDTEEDASSRAETADEDSASDRQDDQRHTVEASPDEDASEDGRRSAAAAAAGAASPASRRSNRARRQKIATSPASQKAGSAPSTSAAATAASAAVGEARPTSWEEKERELIARFTAVIQHLQQEIARQNVQQTSAGTPMLSNLSGVSRSGSSLPFSPASLMSLPSPSPRSSSNPSAVGLFAASQQQLPQHGAVPPVSSVGGPPLYGGLGLVGAVAAGSMVPGTGLDGDLIVDQLASSIISIPALRSRILEKLGITTAKI